MADDVDRVTDRAEYDHLANLSASRKPAGPLATGFCLFCEEELPDGRRWCDAECRDGWELEAV